MNVDGFGGESSKNLVEWPPLGDPQVQMLDFADANGYLPLRYLITPIHTHIYI